MCRSPARLRGFREAARRLMAPTRAAGRVVGRAGPASCWPRAAGSGPPLSVPGASCDSPRTSRATAIPSDSPCSTDRLALDPRRARLSDAADPDVHRLQRWPTPSAATSTRCRRSCASGESRPTGEHFVAWFEPEHHRAADRAVFRRPLRRDALVDPDAGGLAHWDGNGSASGRRCAARPRRTTSSTTGGARTTARSSIRRGSTSPP